MGLYRVPSLTKAALVLVGLQAVSHCALYGLHRQFGSDIVSVKHLLDASGSVRWNLVVDLVIVAPIREEIVFRGILQLIVHRRLPDNCRAAVFMPSFFFSVIHALNFNAGRYSFSYGTCDRRGGSCAPPASPPRSQCACKLPSRS